MIIADTAAVSKSQPVYSNFRWEVNLHHDQNQYKHVIRNWLQSFYSTQSYHVVKDINFDDKNIYHVNSDQIQNNQNFSSNQEKSDLSEFDFKNYFANHIDILILKIRVCWSCKQIFAFRNLLHKHFLKKNCSKKSHFKIHQSDKNHQFNKNHLMSQNSQSN